FVPPNTSISYDVDWGDGTSNLGTATNSSNGAILFPIPSTPHQYSALVTGEQIQVTESNIAFPFTIVVNPPSSTEQDFVVNSVPQPVNSPNISATVDAGTAGAALDYVATYSDNPVSVPITGFNFTDFRTNSVDPSAESATVVFTIPPGVPNPQVMFFDQTLQKWKPVV